VLTYSAEDFNRFESTPTLAVSAAAVLTYSAEDFN
jgi:hypothetical protein